MAVNMRQALKNISDSVSTSLSNNGQTQVWHKKFYPKPSFIAFSGHFPDHPVLPAIVQILMAQITVEEATGVQNTLVDLMQAKFTMPIVPDMKIECTASCIGPHKWQATIYANEQIAASFRWSSE